jgi:hypothetical protein
LQTLATAGFKFEAIQRLCTSSRRGFIIPPRVHSGRLCLSDAQQCRRLGVVFFECLVSRLHSYEVLEANLLGREELDFIFSNCELLIDSNDFTHSLT